LPEGTGTRSGLALKYTRSVRAVISAVALLACAAMADRLDADLADALRHERVPGMSFAVVRHGRLARQGAYGLANLE